jgi:hypothetical protein
MSSPNGTQLLLPIFPLGLHVSVPNLVAFASWLHPSTAYVPLFAFSSLVELLSSHFFLLFCHMQIDEVLTSEDFTLIVVVCVVK